MVLTIQVDNQEIACRLPAKLKTARRWVMVIDEDDDEIMGILETNISGRGLYSLRKILFQAESYDFDLFLAIIQEVDPHAAEIELDPFYV